MKVISTIFFCIDLFLISDGDGLDNWKVKVSFLFTVCEVMLEEHGAACHISNLIRSALFYADGGRLN